MICLRVYITTFSTFPLVRCVGRVCHMGGSGGVLDAQAVSLPPAAEHPGVDVSRATAARQRGLHAASHSRTEQGVIGGQ